MNTIKLINEYIKKGEVSCINFYEIVVPFVKKKVNIDITIRGLMRNIIKDDK